jgi:type IV pilus assembly protein PilC
MPVFTYVARDDAGKLIEDEVTASSRTEAARVIRGEGNFVVRIAPKDRHAEAARSKLPAPARGIKIFREKYKTDDLLFFTNQLAVMVDTGVPLSDALDGCVHKGNSPRFAKALDGVIERVNAGSEFSAALAEYPKVFPPIFVSLIRASEASGQLGSMLERLADHLAGQRAMIKKIKGAVTYPAVMFVFAIGVTVFLMTFVLPRFSSIYAGKEDHLPTATKMLMAFSQGLTAYGLYVLAGLIAVVVGAVFYFRRPAGRTGLDSIKLGLPLIGALYHKTYLTRSLHTLGTMIQAGVSMLDSVQMTGRACGSETYEKMWNKVNDRLETGQQISEALADNKNIPKAINTMLRAGERSGRLGLVLERVARHCEADLNVAIKTATGLLEPAIIIVLGSIVGGLVLALLLPILTISKVLK